MFLLEIAPFPTLLEIFFIAFEPSFRLPFGDARPTPLLRAILR